MITLSASDKLTLTTGAAVSTDWIVEYTDGAGLPKVRQGNVASAVSTELVAGAATITRVVITNAGGSAQTLTFYKSVTGNRTYKVSPSVSLAAGYTLTWEPVLGWRVMNTSGVYATNIADDAELAAIAGLTSAADKFPYFTGSGSAALADLSTFTRTLTGNADSSEWQVDLGLAVGTDVQAHSDYLQDVANLGDPNADRILFWDDSAGSVAYLTASSGLIVSGTTLTTKYWYQTHSNYPYNPTDAATHYFGLTNAEAAADRNRCYPMVSGTLCRVRITSYNGGTLASNESATVYIRKNNTTDYQITNTFKFNARNYTELIPKASINGGSGVSWTEGDYFEIKITFPTWATDPTAIVVNASIEFEQ